MRLLLRITLGGWALLLAAPAEAGLIAYAQENLASDVPGLAHFTDPNLKNPWGISFPPGGPFWVSNQITGTSTLYNGAGQPLPLVVTIPGGGNPTGQVFNGSNDFALPTGGAARFLFASLSGSITGWNPASGTLAQVAVPGTGTNRPLYQGLAIGNNGAGNFLYAADTLNGKIDVYNGSFALTKLAGSFTDPGLPAGFAPHNIQNIGGTLYVTYERDQGGGVVNAFDLNGNFLRRVSFNAEGGPLDDPWGVVIAPASFGAFGNMLLVGNEGDGRISAFNPLTGAFAGQIATLSGTPIENTGLWGLSFGTGGNGTDPNILYFVAGINDEKDGLFGAIRAVPEPSTVVLASLGGLILLARRRWKTRLG